MQKQNNLSNKAFHKVFYEEEGTTYRRGDLIYTPEAASKKVFFIEEGAVKVYKYHGLKMLLKYFIFDNEIFGLDGLIGQEQYLNFAEVISMECKLKIIDTCELGNKISCDLELAKAAFQVFQCRETEMYHRFQSKMFKSTEQIIIELILEIGRRTGIAQEHGIHIPFMPVQGDLATYLGVSRQNVSTAFAKLKKKNIITYTRSNFVIRKPEELEF